MKPTLLRSVLVLSLLINLGVVGAVAYRTLLPPGTPAAGEHLARHLQLSPEQRRQWQESEAAFLKQLAAGAEQIRLHRNRMIGSIFSATPDEALIDAERMAIARLQDEQQKFVIRQLSRERGMLQTDQRERLARLLLDQPVGPSSIEQLHRD